MDFKMISVVISREYATKVKKKSFLVTTFLVPILFAAMCCIPALMVLFAKDECKIVAVVDNSGIVMPALQSNDEISYQDFTATNVDSLKHNMEDMRLSAILEISAIDSTNSVTASTYSTKPLGLSLLDNIENTVNDCVKDYRIGLYDTAGINLKQLMEEVKSSIEVKTFTIDENGDEQISDDDVYRIVSLVFGMVIFLFVTMFSASVMQSVIEEKQSKIVEVLLSSVNAVDLMFGKIIGVALVALTQFLLWIALTSFLVTTVMGIVGKDKLMGMTQQPNTEIVDQFGAATAGMENAVQLDDLSKGQQMMQTVANMDIFSMLGYFFFFFIFGYLLYASMFAAIGSAVENAEDSNQLQIPLTVPLMLGYFIAIYSWNAPDSQIAFWGSIIPFTSPIVMLARIPFGVESWQIWLSMGLLVATFAAMAWLSAKIYRVGILMSGKKATWKDLLRWARQK